MFREDKLLKIMERKHISQTEMAKRLGICRKTFYIKLRRGLFYVDELVQMIEILDIEDPWNELFDKKKGGI